MELVSLSPDLARYFATEQGLLVVRAPDDEALQLRDGDVILEIDGREPTSPGHAMRILRSYAAGERLGMRIVRDKKSMTLELEMPAESVSFEEPERPPLHPSTTGRRVIQIEPEST
jgi:S1-C subfamily serine protease